MLQRLVVQLHITPTEALGPHVLGRVVGRSSAAVQLQPTSSYEKKNYGKSKTRLLCGTATTPAVKLNGHHANQQRSGSAPTHVASSWVINVLSGTLLVKHSKPTEAQHQPISSPALFKVEEAAFQWGDPQILTGVDEALPLLQFTHEDLTFDE